MPMLRLILAAVMATSGCLCPTLCALAWCEHEHQHPSGAPSQAAGHGHDQGDDESPPGDCGHPALPDRSLPDPPPSLAVPVAVTVFDGRPGARLVAASRYLDHWSVVRSTRGRTLQAEFCRFLI